MWYGFEPITTETTETHNYRKLQPMDKLWPSASFWKAKNYFYTYTFKWLIKIKR